MRADRNRHLALTLSSLNISHLHQSALRLQLHLARLSASHLLHHQAQAAVRLDLRRLLSCSKLMAYLLRRLAHFLTHSRPSLVSYLPRLRSLHASVRPHGILQMILNRMLPRQLQRPPLLARARELRVTRLPPPPVRQPQDVFLSSKFSQQTQGRKRLVMSIPAKFACRKSLGSKVKFLALKSKHLQWRKIVHAQDHPPSCRCHLLCRKCPPLCNPAH